MIWCNVNENLHVKQTYNRMQFLFVNLIGEMWPGHVFTHKTMTLEESCAVIVFNSC